MKRYKVTIIRRHVIEECLIETNNACDAIITALLSFPQDIHNITVKATLIHEMNKNKDRETSKDIENEVSK